MSDYELLGISSTATEREIRDAWRAKAFELHPDRCSLPDAEEQLVRVNRAAQTLLNALHRKDVLEPEQGVGHEAIDPELQRFIERLRELKARTVKPKPKAGSWLDWASRYAKVSDMDGLSTVGYMVLGAFMDAKGVPGPQPTGKKEEG